MSLLIFQTMSQLERVSSDNMYKEQAWVEKLLKRMRNEADTQTQSFHTYLVEQLLSVASSILAATKNQQKTVDSLSSKIDKSVRWLKIWYSIRIVRYTWNIERNILTRKLHFRWKDWMPGWTNSWVLKTAFKMKTCNRERSHSRE